MLWCRSKGSHFKWVESSRDEYYTYWYDMIVLFLLYYIKFLIPVRLWRWDPIVTLVPRAQADRSVSPPALRDVIQALTSEMLFPALLLCFAQPTIWLMGFWTISSFEEWFSAALCFPWTDLSLKNLGMDDNTVMIHKDTLCLIYPLERSGICHIPYFCLNCILLHQSVGKLYCNQKKINNKKKNLCKELDVRCWQASPQSLVQ